MRLVLLTALLGLALAARESYDGHKVFRFTPTEEQYTLLKQLENSPGFDFWNEFHGPGSYLDIMVSPEQQSDFQAFIKDKEMDFTITLENVQEIIDSEEKYQETVKDTSRAISFTKYHRHTEINNYLSELASSYPNLVTLQTIGKSYEGRDLRLIKISSGGSGNRPAVLIDAGIHAREWIAPAMALYIINQLVENNAANSGLTDSVDWYIIPVLNPDGYEYSHTTSRMWRKTRSPTSSSSCRGVDGNRNFPFHWMETGASSYPCDETYAGTVAASEPETKALRDFALANQSKIKLYLTFHSYGNYLLYPWGYTSALPSDWRTLQALAEQANSAHVSAGGSRYTIGSSTNVLYAAAGGSDDYMKGVAGIALSYTVELTNSIYGFQFPASQIQSTVSRFFSAVRAYGNYVKQNF